MKTEIEILEKHFNEAREKYPNENWVTDFFSQKIEIEFITAAMREYADQFRHKVVVAPSRWDKKQKISFVLVGIWNGFKTLLAWIFIIHAVLFIVVGGEFSIRLKTENIVELWHVLNSK